MTITAQFEDGVNWMDDTTIEAVYNIANYNVISGCLATPSGANMSVAVAAGTITHNGVRVVVAGSSVTLSADATNPRWARVCLDSTGTAVLVSGTAAADPTTPEIGDTVLVWEGLVQANQTIANSIASKYDRRLFLPGTQYTEVTAASDQTTITATLANDSELLLPVSTNTLYLFEAMFMVWGPTGGDFKCAFTIPSGTITYKAISWDTAFATTPVAQGAAASGVALHFGTNGITLPISIRVDGACSIAGTGGSLQAQIAQETASGTTTRKAKSWLRLY